jgi:hypothetical protein
MFSIIATLMVAVSITGAGKMVTFPLHYEQGCNIFNYDLRT